MIGLLGIAVMIGIAVALSENPGRIRWRLVAGGLALQFGFGLIVLKSGAGRQVFDAVGRGVTTLLSFQAEGARFVFGNLVDQAVPVVDCGTAGARACIASTPTGLAAQTGAFLAFSVLPTIIFFSALAGVLYHLGVMQLLIRGIAWVMQRSLRTSAAETLCTSAEIFLGNVESPLLIRPFVPTLTRSELFAIMTAGLATVAGGVMAAYIGMLAGRVPNIAGHLIAASVMNAVAGLVLAKIMVPETDVPVTGGAVRVEVPRTTNGVIEAAAGGALQGVELAINVAAMLIAFVALVALLNALLGWAGGLVGYPALSLQLLLGQLLRPLAWTMGVPWHDTTYVGGLIGLKTTLNEFVAYAQLSSDIGRGMVLDPRSTIILTYALLGFANFGAIAIQIGGLGGLAPERRPEIASFGLRAMVAGNLAAFISASIAGLLV